LSDTNDLAELKIENVLLRADSPAVGRTLRDLDLRQRTGALIVAIKREGKLMDAPDLELSLAEGDVLYLVGGLSAVRNASASLAPRHA
jgi:K+/H+ antiporter YhaU regulatory subunit KhtT